jgi:hypothetical protein
VVVVVVVPEVPIYATVLALDVGIVVPDKSVQALSAALSVSKQEETMGSLLTEAE